ncbi:hypothetical protein HETIRDRAFT_108705 [Heterobasidion irregulare TC 32-1]|uniref:Uncharacterized protein n=1 Tax=Heterobasidion irregulare (strain TC 32-1) TaxID=747525 RepID=W4K9E4_HETIT|nr:uncharacterized protein HETIRDRAFT_108705 [Heterobasidion irregulare TC 32-1]ETW82403.1 hypothetical protein HETIRDRAFT_108705 [Heterobasidion irregulare TC 32-1]
MERRKKGGTGKGEMGKGDAHFVEATADHFEGKDAALQSGRIVASVQSASGHILAPALVAWAAILCAEEPVADGEWARGSALRCGAHEDLGMQNAPSALNACDEATPLHVVG